jgi:hypothetical protein
MVLEFDILTRHPRKKLVHVYNVRYFRYSFQTSLAVGDVVIEFDNLDECQWGENLQGNA